MSSIPTIAALRALPRPRQVESCPDCLQVAATNYPTCPSCTRRLEEHWLADWHSFLQSEGFDHSSDLPAIAEITFAEGERHLWTVLDICMTYLTCRKCGNELGGGPADCDECASAWGVTLWAESLAGRHGLVTYNEHALHIGRMILRHRHRQSGNIIQAWSRTVPRILTGWLPSTAEAQHFMALIKKGRFYEVDEYLVTLDRQINESTR